MEKIQFKAIRNYDADYISDERPVYYVTIETEDEVLDYVSFDTEDDAYTFIEYYNNKN